MQKFSVHGAQGFYYMKKYLYHILKGSGSNYNEILEILHLLRPSSKLKNCRPPPNILTNSGPSHWVGISTRSHILVKSIPYNWSFFSQIQVWLRQTSSLLKTGKLCMTKKKIQRLHLRIISMKKLYLIGRITLYQLNNCGVGRGEKRNRFIT